MTAYDLRGTKAPGRSGKYGGRGPRGPKGPKGGTGEKAGCPLWLLAIALGVVLIATSLGGLIGLAITAVTG